MSGKSNHETGILTVLTQNIYFFIKASLFFMLTTLPSMIWLIIFERSLVDLIFLFLFGPAIAAMCRLMIAYIETDFGVDDYPEFSDYIKFYKKNFKESLTFWSPYCLLIFILLTNIELYQWTHVMISSAINGIFILAIAFFTLVVSYFFVISAKYKFTLSSLFRLSVFYLFTSIKGTLGMLAVLFLVWILSLQVNEFIVFLLSGPITYMVVRYAYPILEDVNENFIDHT